MSDKTLSRDNHFDWDISAKQPIDGYVRCLVGWSLEKDEPYIQLRKQKEIDPSKLMPSDEIEFLFMYKEEWRGDEDHNRQWNEALEIALKFRKSKDNG